MRQMQGRNEAVPSDLTAAADLTEHQICSAADRGTLNLKRRKLLGICPRDIRQLSLHFSMPGSSNSFCSMELDKNRNVPSAKGWTTIRFVKA